MPHQSSASVAPQRLTTVAALAHYLGVHSQTALRWCRQMRVHVWRESRAAYHECKPVNMARTHWRIAEPEVRALLRQIRQGRDLPIPDSLWD